MKALGEHLGIPSVDLRPGVFDPAAVRLLSKNVARRLCVLPLFKVRDALYVATARPQALPVLDEVAEHAGLHRTAQYWRSIRRSWVRSTNRCRAAELSADLDRQRRR